VARRRVLAAGERRVSGDSSCASPAAGRAHHIDGAGYDGKIVAIVGGRGANEMAIDFAESLAADLVPANAAT